MNYRDILPSLELSPEEAEVYELVLISGQIKAGTIIKKSALKRGNIYNILHKLVSRGLIEDFEINGVAHYRPTHPSAFINEIERKKDALERNRIRFESVLPDLVSEFNKAHQKPTIEYFEGIHGITRALYTSLESKGPIYAYIDAESIDSFVSDENRVYVSKRKKLAIKKDILLFNSKAAKNRLEKMNSDPLTEYRLLDTPPDEHPESILEIYDDAILYITLSEKNKLGVLIRDKRIATLQRQLFEHQWVMSSKNQAR